MPIYEFTCDSCGEAFEQLVWSRTEINDVVCPRCESRNVRRRMSAFAAMGQGRSSSATGDAACATGGG